jgi:hypothetical protein
VGGSSNSGSSGGGGGGILRAAATAAGLSPLRPGGANPAASASPRAGGSSSSSSGAHGGAAAASSSTAEDAATILGLGAAATAPASGGQYDEKDVSRALLIMISNNIGQLAYLNAVRYKCKHVYFAGNFLRYENTIAMRTLAYAISFWSRGEMEGLFLRHEGYCGALGAFLSTLETAEDAPPGE